MYSFLTIACMILPGAYLAHDYLMKHHENKYTSFLIASYLNWLILYSNIEMLLSKAKKRGLVVVNNYLENNPNLMGYVKKFHSFYNPEYMIEFVKNGTIIKSITKENFYNNNFVMLENLEYDFVIFTDYNFTPVRKIIKKDWNDNHNHVLTNMEPFILAEITIGIDALINKTIKIQFANEKYTYLVVDNIFDRKFIRYFMKKHYFNEISSNDYHILQNYTLKIIDGNVKIVTICKDKILRIDKNNYVIEDGTTEYVVREGIVNPFSEQMDKKISDAFSYKTDTDSSEEFVKVE